MFFKASLQQLYREDERPWLGGFSGGKDSFALDKPLPQDLGRV
jgi:tRNA(Ile)-lysidine synthase TilS/MesJ